MAIENFRQYRQYKGCYLPAPEEGEFLLFLERENNKENE